MKVIFVGMHNKPGMAPLDSRTWSGKVIDEVIAGLPGIDCLKTNLSDTDYLPDSFGYNQAKDWLKKAQVAPGDCIVLLGKWVQQRFWLSILPERISIVSCAHPSSPLARSKRAIYVATIVRKIQETNGQS